jgi:DNA-binding IclR family transcriptional regulator
MLHRALVLLRAFEERRRGLSIQEIAEVGEMHRRQAYRWLDALLVVLPLRPEKGDDGVLRYRLGP